MFQLSLMMKKLLIPYLFFIVYSSTQAQDIIKCGHQGNLEELVDDVEQFQRNLQAFTSNKKLKNKMMMEETIIPMQLHIIRNDDGSEVVSMDEIQEGIDLTNDLYAVSNIRFEICGDIRYLNSSADKKYTSGTQNALIDPAQANPNALNVYYFEEVFSGQTKICGLGGAEVYMGCPTGSTLAHEIGHHYTLRHTHGDYNFDPPNYNDLPAQTNGFPTPVVYEGAVRYVNNQRDDNNNQIFDCMETGDGVCDTPAEPIRLGGAFDPTTCTYFGTDTDFYGDPYDPDPGNVMSYGFCQQEYFTPLQLERAIFSLNTRWLNEQCGDCRDLPTNWEVTSAEDFGKGSLRWAYACNKSADRIVNITFNIPEGNTIHLTDRLPTLLGAQINIDGLNKATGEKVVLKNFGLWIESQNVTVKNIILEDSDETFWGGLNIVESSSFTIENCEIRNSSRAFYFQNVTNGNIIGNRVENIIGTAMNIRDSRDITLTDNDISGVAKTGNFDGDGISLSSSQYITLLRNTVDNCARAGVIPFNTANFINVGSFKQEDANTFTNNNTGIQPNGIDNLFFGINRSYCNIQSAYQGFGSNEFKSRPTIFESGPGQIRGTSDAMDTIIIYASTEACSSCQPERFVGLAYANTSGEWIYDLSQDSLSVGLKVLASATFKKQSSPLTSCRDLDVPVGCAELITDFEYEYNFESDINSEFRITGEDFSLLSFNSCTDNDGQILYYNARSPKSASSDLYSKTFDLGEASFAALRFDIAHGNSSSFRETQLEIEVSSDCGLNYTSVYNKKTVSGLRTTTDNSTSEDYFPSSCDEWRQDSIDLGDFIGQEILIKITASFESSAGQNLFLDNIFIDKAGACPVSNTEEGDVYVSIEESNVTLCEGEETSLTYNFNGKNLKWLINGENDPNFDPDIPINQSSTIVAESSNNFGCRFYDTLEVTVFEAPLFDFGDNILACEGDSIRLASSEEATETIWTFNGTTLDNSSSIYFPDQTGMYSATSTINEMCPYSDSISIIINEIPTGTISNDTLICSYDETQIELTTNAATITWTRNDEVYTPSDNQIFTTDEAGQYSVRLSDSLDFCSTDLNVEISKTAPFIIDLGVDTTVCFGEQIDIMVEMDSSTTTMLYKDDELIKENTFVESLLKSGNYRLDVIDMFGCDYSDDITLDVLDTIALSVTSESTTYCAEETAILSAQTPANIQGWSKDDETIDLTSSEIEITESGTYTTFVQNNIGCTAEKSITIEFTELPVSNLGEDIILCEGSVAILEGEEKDHQFEWFLDGEELTEESFSLTTDQSGTYLLRQTDSLGCSSEDEINIEVVPGPVIDIPEQLFTCPGVSIMIEPTSNAENLQWFFNDELLTSESNGTLIANELGTYTLVGTGETGCEVMARTEVLPFETPAIPLEDTYSLCEGETINLSLSGVGVAYTWNIDGRAVGDGSEFEVTVAETYSVHVTDSNGCISTKEFTVIGERLPTVSLDEVFEGCVGDQITIRATSNGSAFSWTNDDNVLSDENSNSITVDRAGIYNVVVTNDAGCISESSTEVILRSNPIQPLEDNYTICFGERIMLDAGDNEEYEWTTGETTQTIQISSTEPDESFNEFITLTVINEFGCQSSDTTQIVHKPQFNPTIESDIDEICLGEEVMIFVDDGAAFSWTSLPDSTSSIMVTPDTTTTYVVDALDGCTGETTTLEKTIMVNSKPEYTITPDTCILEGNQIQLIIAGVDSAQWQAHPSFLTETNITNPVVAPTDDQTYFVEVIDLLGCVYLDTVDVCVESLIISLSAPNVLTPGDLDGFNDVLLFEGLSQISGAELTIFNRWGNEIFRHTSYQSDDRLFDGRTNSGKDLPGGNYFYVLTLPTSTEVIKSSLTIIR